MADIAALERKIHDLDAAISKLRDAKHAESLIRIIHKPGWTTLREEELVHAYLDSIQQHLTHLHKSYDALTGIAAKIGG
jgi:hypothetical protein